MLLVVVVIAVLTVVDGDCDGGVDDGGCSRDGFFGAGGGACGGDVAVWGVCCKLCSVNWVICRCASGEIAGV